MEETANTDTQSSEPRPPREPGRFTWLLALLGVASIGALMVWLNTSAEPTQLSFVDVDEDDPDAELVEGAIQLSLSAFEMQAQDLVGQRVQLRDLEIIGRVGPRLFWVLMPSGAPYLVMVGDRLLEEELELARGTEFRVIAGRVETMDEDVGARWLEAGVAGTEDDVQEALFATTYIELQRVRLRN